MAKKGEARVQFIADTSEFTKGITNINKSLGNLRSDLKRCNAELKANGDSFETLSDKQKVLNQAIEQNADKIQLLKNKLEACKDTLGENSDEYNKLYRQINKAEVEQTQFVAELNRTEQALNNLDSELKDTGDGFDNFGDSADGANVGANGLSVSTIALGSALGSLASTALSWCIEKLGEFAQYLWDLPEATEEFRINMAKLSGATQQYGYDAEFTGGLVKEMYGYLADEQMAVNAVTNLQGMKLSQEDLTSTLDSCVAVWTAYGDSIPIESLTESVNETAQVGKVTGSLADALNWAGISEDEFNKKLEATKTTQERAKLITDTLNGAYGESKKKFDESTKGIQNYRKATYETTEESAELASVIEEVKTEVERFKSKALDACTPAIKAIVDALKDFSKWCVDIKNKLQELQKSPTWQFLKQVADLYIQPMIIKFKVLWEIVKTVIEVCKLLWSALSSLANMFSTLLMKYKPLQDALNWLSERFKKANSSANPLITTLQSLQSKLQTAKQWIDKVSKKWSFSNPQLPSGLQKFIDKANAVYSAIQKIAKTFTLKFNFSIPKLTTKSITVMGQTFSYPAVSWNAVGGIFKKPTIFNTSAGLQGVGEAGAKTLAHLTEMLRINNSVKTVKAKYFINKIIFVILKNIC